MHGIDDPDKTELITPYNKKQIIDDILENIMCDAIKLIDYINYHVVTIKIQNKSSLL